MSPLESFWQRAAGNTERGICIHDEVDGTSTETSYADLIRQARGFASALHSHGIRKGDQVPVCATTTRIFPLLWLGLMWLGATPVPLPPRHAMTSGASYRHRLEKIFPHHRKYICHDSEARHVREVFPDFKTCWKILSLETLFDEARNQALPDVPRAELDEGDIAFVQYTSGSTRSPKGIRVTYGNLLANVQAIVSHLGIIPADDVLISWLPLYHDMGLIGKFLTSILNQNKLVMMAPHAFVRRPLKFLSLIEKHGATFCSMPNFAYELISRRLMARDVSLSLHSMRWFGVGAEPVRAETLKKFETLARPLGLGEHVVSPCYGLAEATLAVSMGRPGEGFRVIDMEGREQVSCGEPVGDFELKIDKETGELRIRGASVARTALIDGEVRHIVDEEGFYNTGDRCLLVDGKVFVLGRIDEMFVVNGENRFPYDIEVLVRESFDEISRCVCVCVDMPDGEARIVLLYERRLNLLEGDPVRNGQITEKVLVDAGLPLGDVMALPPKAIPQTPSGKMQRVQARSVYLRELQARNLARITEEEVVS